MRIWSYLLKKSLMENFIFYAVYITFSEKLTFLSCAYQGMRNANLSENYADVLNE